MRIYARVTTPEESRRRVGIVGVTDDLKKYTTITTFIDTFFYKLKSKNYHYFDVKAGGDMITTLNECYYRGFNIDEKPYTETYSYIGNATNHDELISLMPEYFI